MDAANILKPALARGAIRVIGATTIREYRQTIEKDGALVGRVTAGRAHLSARTGGAFVWMLRRARTALLIGNCFTILPQGQSGRGGGMVGAVSAGFQVAG